MKELYVILKPSGFNVYQVDSDYRSVYGSGVVFTLNDDGTCEVFGVLDGRCPMEEKLRPLHAALSLETRKSVIEQYQKQARV